MTQKKPQKTTLARLETLREMYGKPWKDLKRWQPKGWPKNNHSGLNAVSWSADIWDIYTAL